MADKKIKIKEIPPRPNISKMNKDEAIIALLKHIEKLESISKEMIDNTLELINKYELELSIVKIEKYNKYVTKSEKTETVIVNEVDVIEEKKEKKPRKSPKEKFAEELKALVTEEVVEDYDFEGNGIDRNKVKKIGEDRIIKIETLPTPFKVIEKVRPKYSDKEHIYQAISTDVFPGSVLTPSLAASIIMYKYMLSVPLNRYSEYLKAFDIVIPANNLSNYVKRAAEKLMPIYESIKEIIKKAEIIHVDETTLEVLNVKNKENCYMFVYRTGLYEKIQASLYVFNENRKTDETEKLLEGKEDRYAVVDGYTGYDRLEKVGVKIQRCWTHIRRKFFDCIKILPEEKRKNTKAGKIVSLINELYKYERKFKEESKTASEVKELRNGNKYQKVLKEIDDKIVSYAKCTEKNKKFKEALNYYLNIKEKGELYTFLEDGRIEIDNNLAERTVKPFVIGRKNFLFCKTENGANISAMMYTIVQTCINNGLNPE